MARTEIVGKQTFFFYRGQPLLKRRAYFGWTETIQIAGVDGQRDGQAGRHGPEAPWRGRIGESVYDGNLGGPNAGLRKSVIVQVGEEIDAIFVDFFGRIDIFVAESGEPGVGSDLAHLSMENLYGNVRGA